MCKKIKNIKYVSFDVYETLIKRIVPEKELYRIIENDMVRKNIKFAYGFQQKRINAEKELNQMNVNHYSIQDIYNSQAFSDLSNEEKNILISEEKKAEISNCIVNPSGYRMYMGLKEKYPIICISDMYMDGITIKKILNQNGYFPEKIFVSSNEKKSKWSRELFTHVVNSLGIKNSELFHIGDAKRSDFLNPKILGIQSHLFKNKLLKDNDYYKDLGVELFGPLVFEFCNWIHEKSEDNNLLFLAREGDVFAKFYNQMFGCTCKTVFVSRKAVLKGVVYDYLSQSKIRELIKIISIDAFETVEGFCNRIGIDYKYHQQEFMASKIDKEDRVSDSFMCYLEEHRDKFLPELVNNKVLFDQYLSKFVDKTKINYMVDLGWKGSMQKCIESYFQMNHQEIQIQGLYLGIMNTEDKQGFVFQNQNRLCHNFLCFSGVLETLFMPSYGSVLGYEYKDDEVKPIFDKLEFSDSAYQIIQDVQDGIQLVISRLQQYAGIKCFDKEKCIDKLTAFGCNPTNNDISHFKDLVMYDNGLRRKLVDTYSLKEKLHLKGILHDFIESKWKTAFCINLLKIRLPYTFFINLTRKISYARKDDV